MLIASWADGERTPAPQGAYSQIFPSKLNRAPANKPHANQSLKEPVLCRRLYARISGHKAGARPAAGSARARAAVRAVLSWSVDGNWLPLGRSDGDPAHPASVTGLPASMVGVAAAGHSLAVDAEGRLWSWGRNGSMGGGGGGSAPLAASGQLGGPRASAAAQPAQAARPMPSGTTASTDNVPDACLRQCAAATA